MTPLKRSKSGEDKVPCEKVQRLHPHGIRHTDTELLPHINGIHEAAMLRFVTSPTSKTQREREPRPITAGKKHTHRTERTPLHPVEIRYSVYA